MPEIGERAIVNGHHVVWDGDWVLAPLDEAGPVTRPGSVSVPAAIRAVTGLVPVAGPAGAAVGFGGEALAQLVEVATGARPAEITKEMLAQIGVATGLGAVKGAKFIPGLKGVARAGVRGAAQAGAGAAATEAARGGSGQEILEAAGAAAKVGGVGGAVTPSLGRGVQAAVGKLTNAAPALLARLPRLQLLLSALKSDAPPAIGGQSAAPPAPLDMSQRRGGALIPLGQKPIWTLEEERAFLAQARALGFSDADIAKGMQDPAWLMGKISAGGTGTMPGSTRATGRR